MKIGFFVLRIDSRESAPIRVANRQAIYRENRMGGFWKGGFSNNRFVLKPDVAIASEVSILSQSSPGN